MTAANSNNSLEVILQRLLQQARVNWGDDHAQELQSTLENTSRQLSEVSSNLPGKETEPGFYQ
jgi:hypothetical protein